MNLRKMLRTSLAGVLTVVLLAGCTGGKKTGESANEVFGHYYAAVTGTMSASIHRDDFHWRNGTEPFPYLDEARWTDMTNNLRFCEGDTARMDGAYDTLNLDIGYENPKEATDRVAAYWESQGWEVKDITSEKEPDMRQILTVTDTGIHLLYTASSRGEAIDATSKCIAEFYDEEHPVEEPVIFSAQR